MKDLSKAKTIIRWEIIRNIEIGTLKIDQRQFIYDFLEAEEMTSCHATIFPIGVKLFISTDQASHYNSADFITYQQFVRKLIYLAYSNWPDISFIVGLLNQWNSDPRVGYFHIVKQMVHYLKRMINLGMIWRLDLA